MTVRLSLALQGGGAHGAFTWGVLDRLLQETGIDIVAVSGTSAGALNGAALKTGLALGGRAGARKALARLWRDVMAAVPPSAFGAFTEAARAWTEVFLPVSAPGLAAQVYSPYALGAAYENPLLPVVTALCTDTLAGPDGPALFVSATNVHSGKIRVFSGADITPQALLASACLPTLFQAVDIDGEAYWDGGYAGNPALFPLYEKHFPDDLLIVQINPLRRDAVPMTPADIQDRITEIGFNAPLLRDLRAIAFVKELIAEGRMPRGAMKDLRVHMVADDRLMNSLGTASKLAPTPRLIARLKRAGRRAAAAFLRDHTADLGHRGTLDLAATFG
jgi:NTE family protein